MTNNIFRDMYDKLMLNSLEQLNFISIQENIPPEILKNCVETIEILKTIKDGFIILDNINNNRNEGQ